MEGQQAGLIRKFILAELLQDKLLAWPHGSSMGSSATWARLPAHSLRHESI